MKTLEGTMQAKVNRNLLKWSAGQAIWCPGCQAIMDCRRTVVATLHREVDGKEECVRSYVMCDKCWSRYEDKVKAGLVKAQAKASDLVAWLEVVTWNGFETTRAERKETAVG